MPTLRIEHQVVSYDGWKKTFDSDPIGRKRSGITRYRIYTPQNDTSRVLVELDFKTMEQLEATLSALQALWNKVQGSVMMNPITTMYELQEQTELQ